MFYESGTYANISGNGQWPGLVQSHNIIDRQNVEQIRYLGQANRNVGLFTAGPLDVNGTITTYPQDWKFLAFALGSATRTSGTAQTSNYKYDLAEVNTGVRGNAYTSGTFNPFISFGLEESRIGPTANQNSMRTIKGCNINTYRLIVNQGEPVTAEINFIGQIGSWFSGATTSVTAGSNRPYLWSDVILGIGDTTTQEAVKNLTFELNNNFVGPHYVNGSRVIQVPYPLNREYRVTVTQDLDSTTVGSLYDTYFSATGNTGSLFNAQLDINNTQNTGSHRLTLYFSGCKMTEMEIPAAIGGVTEVNYTFVPGSLSAIVHDRIEFYSPF